MALQALEPLSPIQQTNFPDDRVYTLNSLVEELALMERHLRDGSWVLCSCNPEKHLPLVSGLASEGFGFTDDQDEKEFMRLIRDRARIWRTKIQDGKFDKEDADNLRAWARSARHRIQFRQWTGELDEAPELENVVTELNLLSVSNLEEKHVDEIITRLSEKYGMKKPKFRFINNCNPMKDAYQIGRDLVVKNEDGGVERFPLTDMDEIIICRGGGSAYAVTHEFCHHKDRVEKGHTSEESATKCALDETGNIYMEKSLNTLSIKNDSGGIMSVIRDRPIMDFAPLVAGIVVGELIDETGMIESTVAPFAGGFGGLAKAAVGSIAIWAGTKKMKGAATDFLVGLGLPLAVSGLKETFLGAAPAAVKVAAVSPFVGLQPGTGPYYPRTYQAGLTPYSRPTGLYQGHPTLTVPVIPPRPGIVSPPQMTMYQHMQEPALGGKFILGAR